ncbi:MAG: 1-acyl-sn-glycerol-3-phosphate acyltransferase [Ardenticatenaceae bacterium]|nr:1-acyl-sn-glycerol-3-phosphate acyltransferase [Ardenticatenaceae bacterium]
MSFMRGIGRITVIAIALMITTVIILSLAWLPKRVKGVRLAAWPITYFARFFIRLFNVHVTCAEAEKIRQHHGFIFPNHNSLLDIILLAAILPTRFLAKAEVKQWPFIGWIATAVDTVFVNRQDKTSREQARQSITALDHYPPVVIFPEGGIFEPAETLHPFRYGAFEIAVQGSVPFIPCVFLYEPLAIAFWGDEPLFTSLWRLASRPGPLFAHLFTLKTVYPSPDDDARQLALEAHGAMEAVLTYSGHEDDVLESGI